MELKPSPKIFENYKCDYPENTVKRIEKGFEKLGLKITYENKCVESSGASIHSGMAILDVLNTSQNGKGTSYILSKASAYAELAERFSTGYYTIGIPLPKDSDKYNKIIKNIIERSFLKGFKRDKDLKLTNFENINKYFHKNISKEQYENYKDMDLFTAVVDAYSINQKKTVKVPIYFIHTLSGTNGFASGNTIEEAISQGAFEIFERHTANKIISEKIICPTINPNSIQNPSIKKFIEMFKEMKIEPIIKDFTFNNKIPVIGILFINHNLENDENKLKKDQFYRTIKFGSHPNINEAIIRCFTEHLQGLNSKQLIERSQADILYNSWTKKLGKRYIGMKNDYRYFIRYYDSNFNISFLEKGEKIDVNELISHQYNDCLDDIKLAADICKKNDWDFLVIDYTHKLIDFPTVCIIIPPLSTDFNHFVLKCLSIEDFEERYNYFYGIKDIYSYFIDDKWIKNKNKIKKLIENLEEYLSIYLLYYQIRITRENLYHQLIDIFHILPFLYMSIGEYNEAKKYFEVLLDINCYFLEVSSSFYKSQLLTRYNPETYEIFIDLIDKKFPINYKLKSNILITDENVSDEVENMYLSLLRSINKSFRK